MGLTAKSTGTGALSGDLFVEKKSPEDKIIAFAGNPNVGKSSVFNALTGLHQHTGNWPGKTVATAQGYFKTENFSYIPVDLPGTYSLLAHSQEEEVARNFICFGGSDAAVVVCDATCLERSLNLALQVMEICPKTLICVNLMDEAKRRGIKLDLKLLEKNLGVPVVGTSAHNKKTLARLTETLDKLCAGEIIPTPRKLRYTDAIEQAVLPVERAISSRIGDKIPPRWTALGFIENDHSLISELEKYYTKPSSDNSEKFDISAEISEAQKILAENQITSDKLKDEIVSCILQNAEEVCKGAVISENPKKLLGTASRADKILTSRLFGYPIMLALLMVVFWITIVGANYPSELLSTGLFWLGDRLSDLMNYLNAPDWLHGIIIDGAYRVLAWVVSVMLPPMAIFFPLFTLLEDLGYLPRIAYNLDKPFAKCSACGKQALTMCMVTTILQLSYKIKAFIHATQFSPHRSF